MPHSVFRCLRFLPVWLLASLLAACGGGSTQGDTAPTATINVEGGALDKGQPLVVRFSKTMDVASLRLAGSLGAEALATWSAGDAENDTLTLNPRGGAWSAGDRLELVLDASDQAGHALASLRASYVVRLLFANFAPADVVIGQADFNGQADNQGGPTGANTLGNPYGAVAVGPDGKLFVPDFVNNRVLVYGSVPEANDADAAFVLGQPDFLAAAGGAGRAKLRGPQHPAIGNGKLVVTDYGNNRVLVYGTIPSGWGAVPDMVLGQPDFDARGSSCAAGGMESPEAAVITDDGKLLVADAGNHRVLIWNAMPTDPGQAPDLVLGQSDGDHCVDNDDDQDRNGDGAPTARTMHYPAGIWSDGRRVVVADANNNRVLIWNTFPTSSFQPADMVLGQGGFTKSAANDDNHDGTKDLVPTARTMNRPYGSVSSNGVQLAVVDDNNNRVLVWNSFPTASFQPADVVLGHGSFAGFVENDADEDGLPDATASANVLNRPAGVLFHGNKLFVSDAANSRILVFKAR